MSCLSRRALCCMAAALSLTTLLSRVAPLAAQAAIPTVRVGAQEWMRENLAVTHFRNGDGIPTFPDSAAWAKAGMQRIPAWVSYANTVANQVRYGLLYNHHAATDARGICPVGFRVPSTADWQQLETTLTSARASARLKSATGWSNDGNGTDDAGFGALPGGFRTQNGVFFLESRVGYWWTDDDRAFTAPTALAILLFDYADTIFRIEYPPAIGQSVRCLRG